MGYSVSYARMDELLSSLAGRMRVFGPKLLKKAVRYGELSSVSQIVCDRQSDFSPKEVIHPVSRTLFLFRDGKAEEPPEDDGRDILLFLRACDVHAIERLDRIMLSNGGMADSYYMKARRKLRFALMECTQSFEHCFCASLGTGSAEGCELTVRFEEDRILVHAEGGELARLFEGEQAEDYVPEPVKSNEKKLRRPEIGEGDLQKLAGLELWDGFNDRCIACGGCNMVCGGCSCFDIADFTYSEGGNDGERRRIWSGCMLEDFTRTAGGALARKTPGENMRFKFLHKFYDFGRRFGCGDMCVGCGRCDMRCPQDISFFDTVCAVHDALKGGPGND